MGFFDKLFKKDAKKEQKAAEKDAKAAAPAAAANGEVETIGLPAADLGELLPGVPP